MHTKHTMSNITHLRIHIAPLGFEVDRIVLPAIQMKADKVCLMIHDEASLRIQKPYVERIKKELKKKNIELHIYRINRLDLPSLLKSINEIISGQSEKYILRQCLIWIKDSGNCMHDGMHDV